MTKQKIGPVNLAILPLDEALEIARAGGRSFLGEDDVVAEIRKLEAWGVGYE